jgi:sulfatase maturation enzyme AslB (radical SAM superfamily)
MIIIPTSGMNPNKISKDIEDVATFCDKALIVVRLSIDGDEKTHSEIRGMNNSFKNLIKTYWKLNSLKSKHNNLLLHFCYTLSHFNQNQALETLNHIKSDFDFDKMDVALVRGNPKNKLAVKISPKTYKSITNKFNDLLRSNFKNKQSFFDLIVAAKEITVNQIKLSIFEKKQRSFNCSATNTNIVISESGDVFSCEVLNQKLGSLRRSSYNLSRILRNKRTQLVRKFIVSKKCCCTHEGNLQNSIILNPKFFMKFIKNLIYLLKKNPNILI